LLQKLLGWGLGATLPIINKIQNQKETNSPRQLERGSQRRGEVALELVQVDFLVLNPVNPLILQIMVQTIWSGLGGDAPNYQ
jgi:hypothetical protein